MPREPHVEALFKKLQQAVEISLAAPQASREALQEIQRQGADTSIFFTGGRTRGGFSQVLPGQDKEFLRALAIKPYR